MNKQLAEKMSRLMARPNGHMDEYVPHPDNPLNDKVLKVIRERLLGEYGGMHFWLVNGPFIRDRVDVDFSLAGNYARYSYVPENDVWVERDMAEAELAPSMLHEWVEASRMTLFEDSYDDAHLRALVEEQDYRANHQDVGADPWEAFIVWADNVNLEG
jgi:hypothetical protein